MLEFTVRGDSMTGLDGNLYLGQTFIDLGGDPQADLTAAIRDFNLPTAVAPGDWPAIPPASALCDVRRLVFLDC